MISEDKNNRKWKKKCSHISYLTFYRWNYYNLMASLSRLEDLFLDVTLEVLTIVHL